MSLLFGKRSLPARGAWIEIENEFTVAGPGCSRSPRGERGLKYRLHAYTTTIQRSLPARGAWIEILPVAQAVSRLARRSPRGERGLK